MSSSTEEAHLKIQQMLGRCMLRLQQFERLLKAMVAGMAVEGPIEQLHATRSRQETGASYKRLGHLVEMFTGDYLTVPLSERGGWPG